MRLAREPHPSYLASAAEYEKDDILVVSHVLVQIHHRIKKNIPVRGISNHSKNEPSGPTAHGPRSFEFLGLGLDIYIVPNSGGVVAIITSMSRLEFLRQK